VHESCDVIRFVTTRCSLDNIMFCLGGFVYFALGFDNRIPSFGGGSSALRQHDKVFSSRTLLLRFKAQLLVYLLYFALWPTAVIYISSSDDLGRKALFTRNSSGNDHASQAILISQRPPGS
jgi:hypothetical protein